MAKKQDVKQDDLVSIKPITDNQKRVFEAWRKENKNLLFICISSSFGIRGVSKIMNLKK